MRTRHLVAAALVPLALAQEATTDPYATTTADAVAAASTAATSTSAQPLTQTIAVGRGGNTFQPDVLQVGAGNYVEFQFYPSNHSVIRAEYQYPCVPYELTGVDKVGFFSGFHPVDAILENPPSWTLRINDTNPVFFYCGAPGSCIDFQMVGVINPNATTSLAVQKQDAADSSFMLLPGQSWPSEEADPFSTTSSASAGPTASSTSASTAAATTTPTTTPAPTTSSHSGLSAGAIAGIAIGGAAVLVAAAALIFFCGRKSRRNQQPTDGPVMSTVANPPAYVPPNSYGYDPYRGNMSPTTGGPKHASVNANGPLTDAFGNPTPPAGYGQPYMQGSYPPHMMGAPPSAWPQSPSNDIFGHSPAGPAAGTEQQHLAVGAEANSVRASSPSSVGAAPQPANGGIEAFLQRQARMSPRPENELHAQSGSSPLLHSTSGPYEMSATGTMPRY